MRISELMKQQIITDFKNGVIDNFDLAVAKVELIRQIIEEDKNEAMEVAS